MNFNTISNLMDIYQILCIKIDSLNDKKREVLIDFPFNILIQCLFSFHQ